MSHIRLSNGSDDSDPYADHDILTSVTSPKLSSSTESGSSTDSNNSLPYAQFNNLTSHSSKHMQLNGKPIPLDHSNSESPNIKRKPRHEDARKENQRTLFLSTIDEGTKQNKDVSSCYKNDFPVNQQVENRTNKQRKNPTNDQSTWPTIFPLLPHQIANQNLLLQISKNTLEVDPTSANQGIGDSGSFADIDLQDPNESIIEPVINNEECKPQTHLPKTEEEKKETERKHEKIMLKLHSPEPGERFPDFSHRGNWLPRSSLQLSYKGFSDSDYLLSQVCQYQPPIIIQPEPEKFEKNGLAKKLIITVFLCFCGAGGLAWIMHNKQIIKSGDQDTASRTYALNNCQESGGIGQIGEHACYAPASSLTTKSIKNITIRQGSSTYYKFVNNDYDNVLFNEDTFNAIYKGWFVDYNISRKIQPLRIGKLNMACPDIGVYTVTLHYDKTQKNSTDFDMNTPNPKLLLSTNETQDYVYINCEMSNVCAEATLAIYIDDGKYTYPVLAAENNCTHETSIKRKKVALRKSQFSFYHKVICKPLMDDIKLMDSLTETMPLINEIIPTSPLINDTIPTTPLINKTIPTTQFINETIPTTPSIITIPSINGTIILINRTIIWCDESQCSNSCDKEEEGYYFQHPTNCNNYYQCEYPTLHLRPCPINQQWNPEECTCTLEDKVTDHCDIASKMYDPPLATGNVKICGGS